MKKTLKPRMEMRPRFTGITVAASDLGVTPQHLRLVLTGRRESRRLLDRVRRKYPEYLTVVRA